MTAATGVAGDGFARLPGRRLSTLYSIPGLVIIPIEVIIVVVIIMVVVIIVVV